MKIKCLGAIRTVTGSSFQLDNPSGGQILIDCGLFQGGRQTELRNFNSALYKPQEAKAIVLTHAHMDHSGLVPRLVKAGYRGPVYSTVATSELLKILWLDAAHIQEHEAEWKTKKNKRQGQNKVEPLYTEEDALKANELLVPCPANEPVEIQPGFQVTLIPAGHILGAASVFVRALEDGVESKILFSGDLGRQGQLLIPDPQIPPPADLIFMETTYGQRFHKDLGASIEELVSVINQAYQEGGKILIPTFAVERTQEILFLLSTLWHANRIPKDIPIILDSPLATAASEIYVQNPHLFDQETKRLIKEGLTPLSMKTLQVTRSAEDSQKINDIQGPAIILAGSGMANAGRILHHLKHNLWRPNCHVVFVGFQAQGSTGRRLVDGAEMVKIFREPVLVKAKIHTIGGFSGHADQAELVAWLKPQLHPQLTVVLVHGEEAGTIAFEAHLNKLFPEIKTVIPQWLDTLETEGLRLAPTLEPQEAPREEVFGELDGAWRDSFQNRLERLKALMANRERPLGPAELANLENLLSQAEEMVLRY
ncbi:MAG: MBL fold metallo-hydrolase [Deltaproteobacteria bacterium]|jgi:metallo-beta-lactamase family protein|nr:MBL fold metallo-hydrolase [Deltaproteobacteria bacterium]